MDAPEEETGDGLEIEAEEMPEAAFDIEIDEDSIHKFLTVGDIVDYLSEINA